MLALSEAAPWPELPAFELRETVTALAPQQRTRVRLGWTPDELRVLFHCEDTRTWATMTERDAPLYEEEVVEVFLDPVGDLANYFEIEVNPLNAVLDLVARRNRSGYTREFAWRCEDLRTAARTTPSGWSAELAIPFRSLLAAPPRPMARWSANFCRIDRPVDQPRELSAWSPTRLGTFHAPERFGVIEFRE
ncbi:MAG: carbohydrate-binding family 9-like protein [Chthoniobacteraceae bacterium]